MAWKTSSFLPQGPPSSSKTLVPKGLLDIPEQFHGLSGVQTHDDDVRMLFMFKLGTSREDMYYRSPGRRGLGFALWR